MPYAVLALLVFILSWAIFEVYPYPIAQPDTARYFRQGIEMQWNALHYLDTWNPPMYSLLIASSVMFPEPAVAMYWCHSLLFAASILVACNVASSLFASRKLGFVAAILLFVLEIFLFRVPFYNVELLTEPLYIHTIFMGTILLALHLIKNRHISVSGCAILSIAILTRKIGLIFLLIWAPICVLYLLYGFKKKHNNSRLKTSSLALCILVIPFAVWAVRGVILMPENSGTLTSQYLAWRVGSIATRHNIINSWKVDRGSINEEKLLSGENKDINRKILDVVGRSTSDTYTAELAKLHWEVYRYILHHYFDEYLTSVIQDYIRFFNPNVIKSMEYIALQPNPNSQYLEMTEKKIDTLTTDSLYRNGMPRSKQYNVRVSQVLQWLCCRNVFSRYVWTLENFAVVFIHVYALLMGVAYTVCRKHHQHVASVCGFIALLLCMAFIHALTTVLITKPIEIRLSLPSSLFIHFSLVLGVVLLILILMQFYHKLYGLKKSLSNP